MSSRLPIRVNLAGGATPVVAADTGRSGPPPLIAHIIYRLDVGGLENGLVNLVNHIPEERYRHAILCLTDYTDFRYRIRSPEVQIYALHKQSGKDFGLYKRAYKLLKRLRPDVVHTRNLAALETQALAWFSGVPARVHSEHGWEIYDPDGKRHKYQLLRRLFIPFIDQYIALSKQLQDYLVDRVGVAGEKIIQIYNGVDSGRFRLRAEPRCILPAEGACEGDSLVIGTVGRMYGVKDQLTLVRAFIRMVKMAGTTAERLRLVMVGDGPLRSQAGQLLEEAGVRDRVWLPGMRTDVAELLREFDIFVLPSFAEGISNTILEAMASGLPVVATDVGGNPELVQDGATGRIVPPSKPDQMAEALLGYVKNPSLIELHGRRGRQRVENEFSMQRMVDQYLQVYDGVCGSQPMHSET